MPIEKPSFHCRSPISIAMYSTGAAEVSSFRVVTDCIRRADGCLARCRPPDPHRILPPSSAPVHPPECGTGRRRRPTSRFRCREFIRRGTGARRCPIVGRSRGLPAVPGASRTSRTWPALLRSLQNDSCPPISVHAHAALQQLAGVLQRHGGLSGSPPSMRAISCTRSSGLQGQHLRRRAAVALALAHQQVHVRAAGDLRQVRDGEHLMGRRHVAASCPPPAAPPARRSPRPPRRTPAWGRRPAAPGWS